MSEMSWSPAANDNSGPSFGSISFSDLAKQSGISEDCLLERLAEIFSRREEASPHD